MNATKKIMVIDDEADLTELIGFQFEAKGFEVQTALDGVDALKKVHAFEPDLIILDINMPRMGGVEFYTKICGSDGKPMYPVMVLTARANIEGMFKDLDIDGFMIKPFEIDHLIEEVTQLIIKRRQQKQAMINKHQARKIKKVCVVDNNPEVFKELTSMLLNADYTVVPAKTGAQGIERMMKDVPDVALVSLGLEDIPGDTVILRLTQMAKTMEVKFILYTSKTVEHDLRVIERISTKSGIFTFVEYVDQRELLEAVKKITST